MAITNEQSEPEVRTVGEKQPYDFSKKKKPKCNNFCICWKYMKMDF